ncbi:MAG: putative zinc-binding metallopeptidase, partial [Pseudomonadales bacterium]|nr:putative zinc-binding metallopeptidase [Pseudomonadales bacterium]
LRKQWVTALYPQGGFVTDYAKTNGQEDFAESYACYLCDPQTLNRFPEKYLYMQQLLKGVSRFQSASINTY